MKPVVLFVGGALLIWLVANGKAGAVWQAMFNPQPDGRPADPGTGFPGFPDKPPSGPIKPLPY